MFQTENETTPKRYVVYEATMREILKIAQAQEDNANSIELYRYTPAKRTMTEAQLEKQAGNSWQSKPYIDISLSSHDVERVAEYEMWNAMKSKYRGDLYGEIHKRVLDINMRASVSVEPRSNGHSRVDRHLTTSADINDEKVEYIYDMKEMAKKLDDAKLDYSFSGNAPDDYVYLDELTVIVHKYRIEWMVKDVPRLIKRVIKNNLTYCLKNGKSIVPDEYLDKGEKGVREWQEIKRSSNKNNSMEKRMVRDILKSKRDYAYDCVHTVTRAIVNPRYNYSMPCLEVEGRWNTTKVKKMVSNLFKDMSDSAIMQTSEEDILDMVKTYWKEELESAIRCIEAVKDTK